MGTDVGILEEGAEAPPETVCVRVPMTEPSDAFTVVAEIGSGQAEAAQIASALLRRPVAVDDDASEVMGEVVNTIAGRLRACLQARRVDLRMGMPESSAKEPDAAAPVTPDLTQRYRCGTGTIFEVRVYLRRGEGGAEAPSAGAASTPAETVGATASVDDALF
jgi:hypothetical protein